MSFNLMINVATLAMGLMLFAYNLKTESLVLLVNSKNKLKLSKKFKSAGIFLVALSVICFAVGCWFTISPNDYITPNTWMAVAGTIVAPGVFTAIKGVRLTAKKPKELGSQLNGWSRWIKRVSILFILATIIGSIVLIFTQIIFTS